MSDNLLEEYKKYYAVRAEKYADNEKYKHSYEAEKRLSDAMQSCSTLEEFKDRMGNLNEECAIALVKDEAIIDEVHFEKHKEIVRILGPQRVLEKADEFTKVFDLIEMVTETLVKNGIEISMDESHREFIGDWHVIDNYIIYKNAVVPDEYKQDMKDSCQAFINSMIKSVEFTEKNNHEWEAGWRLIPEKNLEYRHRRLLPFSDEHIQEQLQLYKSLINR